MIEEFKLLKYTILIFKPDPCKKCLVRACCRELCEEKQDLKNFLGCDSIKSKRLCAASIWGGLLSMSLSIIFRFI